MQLTQDRATYTCHSDSLGNTVITMTDVQQAYSESAPLRAVRRRLPEVVEGKPNPFLRFIVRRPRPGRFGNEQPAVYTTVLTNMTMNIVTG